METIAIVIGVITGVAGITGATYKCYRDIRNPLQEIVIHEPDRIREVPATPPPSPVFDKIVKHHMEQRDSDGSDTEIDIKIHIQSHNHEERG